MMKDLSESLRVFLEKAKVNILWTAAFALFAYLFVFLIGFLPTVPTQAAQFKKKSVEFARFVADGDKVLILLDTLKEAFKAADNAEQPYQSVFGGMSARQSVEFPKLVEGIGIIGDTRRKLAVATGAIQGMGFYDARLSEFKNKFEGDLRSVDTVMGSIEGVYIAKLSGNIKDALESVKTINGQMLKRTETLAAILARLQTFEQEAHAIQANWMIEISEDTSNIKWVYRKFYISQAALIYEAGFIALGIITWLRSHQRRSRQTQPDKKGNANSRNSKKRTKGAKGA